MSDPSPGAEAPPSATQLWLWPGVLGVLTASGLLSALVSDGWGDAWSWVALGIPVAVMSWCALARRGGPAPSPSSTSNEQTP